MADDVLARYRLRTPGGYVAVLAILIVIGVAAAVVLCMWLARPYRGGGGGALGVMLALLAVTPVWYALTTRAYRIAGGRGELVFYRDRIEVRDARRALAFPAASLVVVATPMVVRYRAWGVISLGVRRAGTLVALGAGSQRLTLSSKTLDDEDWLEGLLEDIGLLRAGERPRGPRRPAPPPKPVTVSADGYDYEAELDRELRRYEES